MLLVIDAGNTNIVFAVFDGEEIVGQWRISTDVSRTCDEYARSILDLIKMKDINVSSIKDVVIASVVPQGLFALESFCKQYLGCSPNIVGQDGFGMDIKIDLDKPKEAGADRIVNAVAAYKKYGGDLIVIDFGTATTFDVVGSKGEYLGGVIAPGVNLSIKALHNAAANLPEVAIVKPEKVIGKSTVGAMQSGIYWGYVGLIEGIAGRIKNEYKNNEMKVIATGGLAPLFANNMDVIDHLEPDLTILGLWEIYNNQVISTK